LVTDRGNEFLMHFQALEKLCPRPNADEADA